jgi:prepilin-type N-terminal cleavage/methylation domain-containing protein
MRSHRAGRRSGFTLVELLIVMSIIALLLVWLVVALVGAHQRSKIVNTQAFIDRLKAGCVTYQQKYGSGRDYPPMDDTGPNSSKNLTKYLLSPITLYRGFANVTAAQQMPGLSGTSGDVQKPLLTVEESRMNGGCLIDFWDQNLQYFSGSSGDPFGGLAAHNSAIPANVYHFDIVSEGPYPGGTDPDGKDCRIATFKNKSEVQ